MERPEFEFQCRLVDALLGRGGARRRLRADVLMMAIPNGSPSPRERSRQIRTGAFAGAPDLLFVRGGRLYCLELKSERGALSLSQISCHAELRRCGAEVAAVRSPDAAMTVLSAWGLLAGADAPAPPRPLVA